MGSLNDRAAVEMLQTYIGTARRSEPLLCSDSPSAAIVNLSTNLQMITIQSVAYLILLWQAA